MSRHFCCCIPVRIAVFVTSLLAFLAAGIIAAASWAILIKSRDPNDVFANLSKNEKIAFGVVGGVYTLICLISLFGFIGAIIRKRSYVALYSTMCYVILFVQIAISAFAIFSLFHTTSIDGVPCQVTKNDGQFENCNDIPKKSKIMVIVLLIVELLIQSYIVGVIHRYVRQLDEEQSYNRASGHVDTAFKMGPTTAYYPHEPLDQGQGLLAPQGHYPYSDPHHSFGR